MPSANSRVPIRARQQMEGCEYRGQMRLTDALVPARVWVLHGQRASRADGKKGGEQEQNERRIRAKQEVKERAQQVQPPCNGHAMRFHVACGASA
jgi:hypothetical protein